MARWRTVASESGDVLFCEMQPGLEVLRIEHTPSRAQFCLKPGIPRRTHTQAGDKHCSRMHKRTSADCALVRARKQARMHPRTNLQGLCISSPAVGDCIPSDVSLTQDHNPAHPAQKQRTTRETLNSTKKWPGLPSHKNGQGCHHRASKRGCSKCNRVLSRGGAAARLGAALTFVHHRLKPDLSRVQRCTHIHFRIGMLEFSHPSNTLLSHASARTQYRAHQHPTQSRINTEPTQHGADQLHHLAAGLVEGDGVVALRVQLLLVPAMAISGWGGALGSGAARIPVTASLTLSLCPPSFKSRSSGDAI